MLGHSWWSSKCVVEIKRRRRNAKTLRLTSYPGRAHSEALISLCFKSRNYTNIYIPRLLWGFSMPVIIRSGAQFTEKVWKLCFHYNCVETVSFCLFVYFVLFCFLRWGRLSKWMGQCVCAKTQCQGRANFAQRTIQIPVGRSKPEGLYQVFFYFFQANGNSTINFPDFPQRI